jgi:hypothetical protein
MSKKRTSQRKPPGKKPPEKKSRRRWMTKTVVSVILICVAATGAAVSRYEPLRRTLGLSAATTPAQAPPGSPSLAKEYIYAGGRLIATEEPTPSATPSSPTNLGAIATSTTTINLTWDAPSPSPGTITHYVIERTGRSGVTTMNSGSNASAFTDPTAQLDNVYRYRVQAVFSGGGTSGFSNGDLATTFFLGDPVVGGHQTVIRAKHFTDLRQAVNDVRLIAGVGNATWSTPAPAVGGIMRGNHVEELRTNLKPALDALGLPEPNYYDLTPPSLSGKVVRAEHINDLRERMK